MNPDEPPPKDALPPTADEIARQRRAARLEAAITPRGIGYSGRRENYTPPPDHPLQPCDFKKWSRRDSIAIEQACFVLLGYEPQPLRVLKFVQNTCDPSHEPTWEAPPDYDDVLQSLRLSIEHGNISAKRIREGKYATSHVTLPDLVRWAKSKDYAIAPEIESIITKTGPAGSDEPAQSLATPEPEPASPESVKWRFLWRAVRFDENRVEAAMGELERFDTKDVSEIAFRDKKLAALTANLAQIEGRKDELAVQMGAGERHLAEHSFAVAKLAESRRPLDTSGKIERTREIDRANKEIDALIEKRTAPLMVPADASGGVEPDKTLPVVAERASDGVEPTKAGPVDKGWVMKRKALMEKHAAQWPTVGRDFQDASDNELSKDAKAPGHGNWFEAVALNWARQRGKLTEDKQQGPASLSTVWTGKAHTIEG